MLRELTELWPGGATVSIATYFIVFKYFFSLLLLVLAVGSLRWPYRRWILAGTLLIASLSFAALAQPLGRPYGIVEREAGLENLGHIMVTAAGTPGDDGRLIGQSSPHPLWGRLLGVLSGFDAARLWNLYPWVAWLSLLCLGCAVAASTNVLEPSEKLPGGVLCSLAAFFVLLLSSNRLSFLGPEGPFWVSHMWSAPHRAVALAGVCLCLRWLGGHSLSSWTGAAFGLAFVGWIEPRLSLCLTASALVWVVAERKWRRGLALGLGWLLFAPFRDLPFGTAPEPLSWHQSANRILSVTVDLGLVFALSMLGVLLLVSSGRSRERLLGLSTLAAVALSLLVTLVPFAAAAFGPSELDGHLRLLLAATAAYGLYRSLVHLGSVFPRIPDVRFVPPTLRRISVPRVGLSVFLLLSLPWCFPYWWSPVLMDPTYVASRPPVSGNLLAMADYVWRETAPDAVFAAGPSYAPWIPALAGRRVLLVDSSAPDFEIRKRAEQAFVFSKDATRIASAAAEWNLSHVAWGRLDQPPPGSERAVADVRFFSASPLFVERYRLRRWVWIFEYIPRE